MMRVIVGDHILFKLWHEVSKPDSVDIDVHSDVSADIFHGAHVNLPLSGDQIFPDIEVLVYNVLLIILPSEEKFIEIGIAMSIFVLNRVPPIPDMMVIPLEGNIWRGTSAILLVLMESLDW